MKLKSIFNKNSNIPQKECQEIKIEKLVEKISTKRQSATRLQGEFIQLGEPFPDKDPNYVSVRLHLDSDISI